MDKSLSCPPSNVLMDLLQGKMVDPELSELSSHLEDCPPCQQIVKTLSPHDTLVASLRGEARAEDQIAKDVPRPLVEKIKRIAKPTEDTNPDTIGFSHDSAASSGDPELSFLSPPQESSEIGRMGHYRILKILGKGGMGAVFLADDPKLERQVALKVMLPKIAANPSAKDRFLREARAAAKLKSDHIVTIYQVDEVDGVPYLAMELLEGKPLDEIIRADQSLSVAEILHIGRDVAKGLAVAHEKGLIHRDIKPANLWIEGEADGTVVEGRVKILDFGLARAEKDDVNLTQSGVIVGTPAFMAPEQARGEKGVDARADLFSLGCVLYRLCVGHIPFKAETTMGTLMAIAMNHPDSPSNLNANIPPELSEFIMQLLAKEPAKRPATARAVIARLNEIEQRHTRPEVIARTAVAAPADTVAAGADEALSAKSEIRPTPPRKRTPRIALATTFCAGLLVLLGGVFYIVTDNGTIEIKTDDKKVKVIIEDAGGKVTIFDPLSKQTYVVNTGNYTVRLGENADGLEIDLPKDRTFEMKRGGMQVVTIRKVQGTIAIGPGPDGKDGKADGTPIVPPAIPGVVALIPLLDAPLDVIEGDVRLEGSAIRLGYEKRISRHRVSPPVAIKGQYDLEVEFTRIAGDADVNVVAPVADTSALILLSGWKGRVSGISSILGVEADKNPTMREGRLENGRRYRLHIAVRFKAGSATITVNLDGAPYVSWSGPVSALSLKDDPWKLKQNDRLALGCRDSEVVFHSARLKLVDGEARHVRTGKIVSAKWVKADGTPVVDAPSSPVLAFPGVVEIPGLRLSGKGGRTVEAYVRLDPALNKSKLPLPLVGISFRQALQYRATSNSIVSQVFGSGSLSASLPAQERWVHVAAVLDGSKCYLFVDGKKCPEEGIHNEKPLPASGNVFTIGHRDLVGQIREVRISKVARYDKDFTPQKRFEPDADTLALYHFDEGSGDVLTDSSGNGHDGKIVGAKWVKADGTAITSTFPPLDPAWFKAVAAMTPQKQVEAVKAELMKRNPGFDGIVKHVTETNVVTELAFLADNVTDLSPVRAFPGLTSLDCSGSGKGKSKLSNLSPLKDMKLTSLRCYLTQVSDLSPLKDMKLTLLYCWSTPVSDLSPLKDMKLMTLACAATQVSDLSPLKRMPLTKIECDFKAERDAAILRSIKTLETINGKPAAEFWKDVSASPPPLDNDWLKAVARSHRDKAYSF